MKRNKGITLIALVITIIVLLILAGVSIATLTGENGIIKQASKAKTETAKMTAKEKVEVEVLGSYGKDGKLNLELLKQNIKQHLNIEITTDSFPVTVTVDGYKLTIHKHGIVDIENDLITMPKIEIGVNATENATIDGREGTYNNPIIPKGFKAINEGKAIWTDENGYKNGLVIEDVSAGDDITKGSQFVWIPVPNYDDFHLIPGYYQGKLDDDCFRDNYPVREAGSSLTRALPGKPNSNNSVNGTKESVAMYESVKKNKGFYIARYEAGIDKVTVSTITNDSEKQIQDGSIKPVSKKGKGVWNFISWGGTSNDIASDGLLGNDDDNGSVKVARSMYGNGNTTIKSTLCYGVQWDAILNFIDSNYVDGKYDSANPFIVDSTDKGNYTGVIATTGSDDSYCINNIYDLAGNIYEWTMEARGSTGRVARGGSFTRKANYSAASTRTTGVEPERASEGYGFRVALYVE